MNVYADDVEAALHAHPDVVEAAVVGIPHDVLGEDVAAWVVLRPGSEATADELRRLRPPGPWPTTRCPAGWWSWTSCPATPGARWSRRMLGLGRRPGCGGAGPGSSGSRTVTGRAGRYGVGETESQERAGTQLRLRGRRDARGGLGRHLAADPVPGSRRTRSPSRSSTRATRRATAWCATATSPSPGTCCPGAGPSPGSGSPRPAARCRGGTTPWASPCGPGRRAGPGWRTWAGAGPASTSTSPTRCSTRSCGRCFEKPGAPLHLRGQRRAHRGRPRAVAGEAARGGARPGLSFAGPGGRRSGGPHRPPTGCQEAGASGEVRNGSARPGSGSRGRPSTRSPMMFRCT